MNILHISNLIFDRPHGPTASILGLSRGLVSNGHKVAILPSSPLGKMDRMIPQKIHLLPSPKAYHLNPWKISKKWVNLIEAHCGIPDIINFHSTYIPFHSALALHFRNKGWSYIISPRGGMQLLARRKKGLKKSLGNCLFFRRFVNGAAAIHALAENEVVEVEKFCSRTKVFIVPNGVDEELPSLAATYKAKESIVVENEEGLTLCFVGRIDVFHKGIDLLLSALKLLEESKEIGSIRLFMIGNFHTAKDKYIVKYMKSRLKFPDRVVITGPMFGDDKWRWLIACDVFVHVSRFEGMPSAVLEAMAFGKPCIVTPGTNMQDIISFCNGGWLCDGNVSSIANTVSLVVKNKGEVDKRGRNARNYIENNLTWKRVARRYVKELQAIKP